MLTTIAFILLHALAPINLSDLSGVDLRMPLEARMGVIAAVNADEEAPLLGSKKAEALLVSVYMRQESFFKRDAVGDHGRSLGSLQLQGVPRAIAFDYEKATGIWLHLAHQSAEDCRRLPEEEQLAELASGNCGHGHRVARVRARTALGLLDLITPENGVEALLTP
jgi:hypothetical protein